MGRILNQSSRPVFPAQYSSSAASLRELFRTLRLHFTWWLLPSSFSASEKCTAHSSLLFFLGRLIDLPATWGLALIVSYFLEVQTLYESRTSDEYNMWCIESTFLSFSSLLSAYCISLEITLVLCNLKYFPSGTVAAEVLKFVWLMYKLLCRYVCICIYNLSTYIYINIYIMPCAISNLLSHCSDLFCDDLCIMVQLKL